MAPTNKSKATKTNLSKNDGKARPKSINKQMTKSGRRSVAKASGKKCPSDIDKSNVRSGKMASKQQKTSNEKASPVKCTKVVEEEDLRTASGESVISATSSQNVVPKRRKSVKVSVPHQETEQVVEPAKEVERITSDDQTAETTSEDAPQQEESQASVAEPVQSNSGSFSRISTDSTMSTTVALPANGEQTLVKIPKVVLADGWVFAEEIGRGAFARVFRVSNENEFPEEHALACKMFDLRAINSNWTRKHLRTEMWIARSVQHPNLMSALKVMKTSNHAFIFMRMAQNGTILNHMYYKLCRPLPENIARLWFRGLLAGLHFLHSHDIVHRDLKLDNFLLDDALRAPMITDFGFAVKGESNVVNFISATIQRAVNFEPAVMCETVCGTPEYVAPEVHALAIGKRYDAKPVDMYALGVALFEMVNLTKLFPGGPFKIRSNTLIQLQHRCHFAFNPRVKLSQECLGVITALLNPIARSRPTANALRMRYWITRHSQ